MTDMCAFLAMFSTYPNCVKRLSTSETALSASFFWTTSISSRWGYSFTSSPTVSCSSRVTLLQNSYINTQKSFGINDLAHMSRLFTAKLKSIATQVLNYNQSTYLTKVLAVSFIIANSYYRETANS